MLLTLLALAVPPAFAISDEAFNTVQAGPAAISVSTSLDSCGIIDDGVVCKLDVSFNSIPNASTYSATVTRADGSVIDYGAVGPGGTSLWVPYVGAGNYSVKITAYGEVDTPAEVKDGHGEVIATGYSQADRDGNANGNDGRDEQRDGDQGSVETDVTGRDPGAEANPDADGATQTDVGSAATEATTPECTTPVEPTAEPPTPPEEPPADTDPDNPDEDADGIPDDQERAVYDQQMAEYQAAVQAQATAAAPAPGC